MKGNIGLRALSFQCIIGIHPHERETPQRIELDLEVGQDFAAAAASDDVQHTSDYALMAELLEELARERQYQLLETYAEEAACLLFERFAAISSIRMEIRKPQAVPAAAASFVNIERMRGAS
tara:strand:- start:381 stop:746 length:366 start_codon:yes stop_codon:yes gene_type:complete